MDRTARTVMLKLRLEGMTYERIGEILGVSRQYIQQSLSPPSKIRKFVVDKFNGKCKHCGILVGKSGHVHHNGDNPETYNDVENLELLCISCHRIKHRNPKNSCQVCGKPCHNGHRTCSEECHKQYFSTMLICSTCGKEFKLRNSFAKARTKRSQSGLVFCSRECFYKSHYTIITCPNCGKGNPYRNSVVKARLKKNKSGKICCSHNCSRMWWDRISKPSVMCNNKIY